MEWKLFITVWLCLGLWKFMAAGPLDGNKHHLFEYLIGLPLCLVLGPVWWMMDVLEMNE